MLTFFSLFSPPFAFLFSFSYFTYLYHIYLLSLGVWDPNLMNTKLHDGPQLWLVLPPAAVNSFHKKPPSQMFNWILNTPLLLL